MNDKVRGIHDWVLGVQVSNTNAFTNLHLSISIDIFLVSLSLSPW